MANINCSFSIYFPGPDLGSGNTGYKIVDRPLFSWSLLLKQHGLKYDCNCLLLSEVAIFSGITWRKQPAENKYIKFYKTILRLSCWYEISGMLWSTASLPISFPGPWRSLTVVNPSLSVTAMGRRERSYTFPVAFRVSEEKLFSSFTYLLKMEESTDLSPKT